MGRILIDLENLKGIEVTENTDFIKHAQGVKLTSYLITLKVKKIQLTKL